MKSVCLVVGFFRHVGLPQEELVQEGVDRVGTLHHNHVTSFINDFQECEQKDLEKKKKKDMYLLICVTLRVLLCF